MSQTLYRKYRPKNFEEIIGQKHIVKTLSNAIRSGRVGQAYLFSGPRGTGKTSIARILAKTINCADLDCEGGAGAKSSIRRSPAKADETHYCKTCEACPNCKIINEGKSLDIIEIDAASYTGVDNIRELRETINFAPSSLKYKVYIIDEVHMLSAGAWNALLKTLEEPPTHVVFILATTEIHKVPETIISRCQRFDFARLPIQNIIEKLSLIAKSEEVKIDKDSLEMIAIAAEGGMRDAESILGQMIALEDKDITRKEVEELLGATDRKFAYEIAEMIIENRSGEAIEQINSLLVDGYDLQIFNKTLVNYLRQLMLLKVSPELKSYFTYELTGEQLEKMVAQSEKVEMPKIISTIDLFLEAQGKISSFILPQLPLEIAIIRATGTFPAKQEISSKFKVQSSKPQTKIKNLEENTPLEKAEKIKEASASPEAGPELTGEGLSIDAVRDKWGQFLEAIRPHNNSLRALLSSCRVQKTDGEEVLLCTSYDFYKDRLNDAANKSTMEKVLGEILGRKVIFRTVTEKEAGVPPKETDKGDKKNNLIQSALEMFGGKLVDE